MSVTSPLGMRLSMFMTMKSKIIVELKSLENRPFICQAKDFVFGEEETRVEFTRLEETVFPTDADGNKSDSFIVYMIDINHVERIRE